MKVIKPPKSNSKPQVQMVSGKSANRLASQPTEVTKPFAGYKCPYPSCAKNFNTMLEYRKHMGGHLGRVIKVKHTPGGYSCCGH